MLKRLGSGFRWLALWLAACALTFSGCASFTPGAAAQRALPPAEVELMIRIADEFWSAASQGDSLRMRAVVTGEQPLVWSARKVSAFPTFFDETRGQLTAEYAYYPGAASDTAIVQLKVPFQTCRPPYHTEGLDRYYLMVVPVADRYRIIRIWSDPC
jgi:hypothetical protein